MRVLSVTQLSHSKLDPCNNLEALTHVVDIQRVSARLRAEGVCSLQAATSDLEI